MAVTLDRIARMAGCSYGTVSNILSRNDTRYSDKTRQRVKNVARQLGYIPHAAAQTLATGRSGNIGIIGVNWNDNHLLKAVAAAGQIVSDHNHKLVLDAAPGCNQAGIMLLQRKVDLVLALHFLMENTNPTEDMADAYDRIISVNAEPSRIPNSRYTMFWDDVAGGAMVADYLMGLGHRRMAVLSCGDLSPRTRGFLRRCESAGLRPLLVITSSDNVWQQKALAEFGWDPRGTLICESSGGAEQIRAALAKEPDITGVFARNDRVAASALTAAEKMGMSVPARLSIMGYCDESENMPCQRRISSVHTPIADGVRVVLEDYFSALREKREPRREDVRLDVRLAIGHTTAPVATTR
ncbi:MAG: LacI family DNA-binding transcriptional regulator [Phycisphaerae bacterium]|nr:LacI family DNA-binding transcriptional regulator [Phycisphaerae bacterium]